MDLMESNVSSISGLYSIRMDSIDRKILRFGPPIMDSSARILTSKSMASKSYVEEKQSKAQAMGDYLLFDFISKYFKEDNDTKTLLQSFDIYPEVVLMYVILILIIFLVVSSLEGMMMKFLRYRYLKKTLFRRVRMRKEYKADRHTFCLRNYMKMFQYIRIKTKKTFIRILEGLLLKSNYEAKSNFGRILWVGYLFFILIFISGISLNLVSVEQVAEKPPPLCDALKDYLYDEDFSHMEPLAVKFLQLCKSAEQALPGSDMNVLYQKLLKYPQSIATLPSKEEVLSGKFKEEIFNRFRKVSKGKWAFIGEDFISTWISQGFCSSIPRLVNNLHGSKPFNQGYSYLVYSLNITPSMRDIADYYTGTHFEFGLAKFHQDSLAYIMFSYQNTMSLFVGDSEKPTYGQTMDCLKTLDSTSNMDEGEKEVLSIQLSSVISLLFLSFCIIISSLLILFIEIFHFKRKNQD